MQQNPRGRTEIDDSTVMTSQMGRVVYVKDNSYGFIRLDNKDYDDVIFFMVDVEPWRHGYKQLLGFKKEPYFPGERVKCDVRRTGKVVKGRQGYQAVNIEIIEEVKNEQTNEQ